VRSPTLHNRPELLERRRELRASLTLAEALLWKHLQRRQLDRWKFRRQHSVGRYVLDFYCPNARLGIELDGAAHDHDAAQVSDLRRTTWLEAAGIRIVRFENRDVLGNVEGVLSEIQRALRAAQVKE
jgi:very-short-patch-repair endonuclease